MDNGSNIPFDQSGGHQAFRAGISNVDFLGFSRKSGHFSVKCWQMAPRTSKMGTPRASKMNQFGRSVRAGGALQVDFSASAHGPTNSTDLQSRNI
jgi:hypothetical protein